MDDQRLRQLHWASIVVAVLLVLLALAAFGGSGQGGARFLVLLALLALLAVQVVVWARERRRAAPQGAAWEPGQGAEPQPGLEEPARMVIRCKQCGEVFPVTDTGVRPLVAACPHCGKSGTIKVRADVP
jgi:hypothetical protein